MANNIFQQRIKPVAPKVLENERVFVYVPKATTQNAGIAYYNPADFTVSNLGQVSVIWPYAHNGDFGLVKIAPDAAGYLQFTEDNNHYLELALDKLDIHTNGLIDTKITAHNTDSTAHNDIRLNLTEIRNDLLDGTLKPLYSTNADNYTDNGNIASKFNEKLDVKPNGLDYLIVDDKLNPSYLPAGLSGGLIYAGTFDATGIITASEYTPELQGTSIDDLNVVISVGMFFQYTGQTPYTLGDLQINFEDQIICNGNIEPNWTKIDNSDKVVSVNGMVGAVNISALPNPQKLIIRQDEQTTEYDGSSEVNIDISSGIQELVGTEENPINFATDMEDETYYLISGKFVYSSAVIADIRNSKVLAYKMKKGDYFTGNNQGIMLLNGSLYGASITSKQSGMFSFNISNGYVNSNSWVNFGVVSQLNNNDTSNFGGMGRGIYAPMTSGTSGQILQSNGSGNEPTWIDFNQGITTLVGTEDQPINFATSMEVGKLYSCTGYIQLTSERTQNISPNYILIYKRDNDNLTAYGVHINNSFISVNSIFVTSTILINDSGFITGWGSAIAPNEINGSPTSTSDIYAPTKSGNVGQILQSNGSGKAPTWADLTQPQMIILDKEGN